jgi:hypothetical protein
MAMADFGGSVGDAVEPPLYVSDGWHDRSADHLVAVLTTECEPSFILQMREGSRLMPEMEGNAVQHLRGRKPFDRRSLLSRSARFHL